MELESLGPGALLCPPVHAGQRHWWAVHLVSPPLPLYQSERHCIIRLVGSQQDPAVHRAAEDFFSSFSFHPPEPGATDNAADGGGSRA